MTHLCPEGAGQSSSSLQGEAFHPDGQGSSRTCRSNPNTLVTSVLFGGCALWITHLLSPVKELQTCGLTSPRRGSGVRFPRGLMSCSSDGAEEGAGGSCCPSVQRQRQLPAGAARHGSALSGSALLPACCAALRRALQGTPRPSVLGRAGAAAELPRGTGTASKLHLSRQTLSEEEREQSPGSRSRKILSGGRPGGELGRSS